MGRLLELYLQGVEYGPLAEVYFPLGRVLKIFWVKRSEKCVETLGNQARNLSLKLGCDAGFSKWMSKESRALGRRKKTQKYFCVCTANAVVLPRTCHLFLHVHMLSYCSKILHLLYYPNLLFILIT
jgi:hypothetical protein